MEIYNQNELDDKIKLIKKSFCEDIKSGILEAFNIPDDQLNSVLIGSDMDIKLTLINIKNYITFRYSYSSEWIIREYTIAELIKSKIVVFHKQDKNNYPCLIIRIKNFINYKHLTDDVLRFLFYIIDSILENLKKSEKKKICIIWDRSSYNQQENFSPLLSERLRNYRDSLTANFQELIYRVYVCNVNLFFRTMFHLAKIFIPKKYVDKVYLLADNEGLLEYFDEDCLPVDYGGKCDVSL